MSGYTPVFRTVFEGSLCGQYPDTAAWLFVLALADKNGHVDKTPQYISAVTGMPVEEFLGCVERFMQPDPTSRSPDEDGRRLISIDPSRSWGWRIVNHEKYREKARLTSKNAREVEEGRNRERLKERRRPPVTAGDRLLDADADSDAYADKETEESRSALSYKPTTLPSPDGSGPTRKACKTARRLPEDFGLTADRKIAAAAEGIAAVEREFDRFLDYWRAASGANARKHDWDATWRNWCRRAADTGKNNNGPRPTGGFRKTRADEIRDHLIERERNATR